LTDLLRGPWNKQETENYLASARYPLRLSCVGSDGFPRVVSLWYSYEGGNLYCVTHQASKIASLLLADPRVGFEVSPNEPPYCGVRGQGRATLDPLGQSPMLQQLLDQYLGDTESDLASWLLSRSDEEFLIQIEPVRLYTWDYRERMAKNA
jgi:hypothetical protein